MIKPMKSGHCAFPASDTPHLSHERCHGQGAGNTSRPSKEFQPCPCGCHLDAEEYECGNCGRELRAAPMWPNEDEPDEMVYVHIDHKGDVIGEMCS